MGLTFVEPLADVEVNVPGVIPILVAPAAAQLNLLLVPEVILAGTAAKDVIAGPVPFPEGEVDKPEAAQPARVTNANRAIISAPRSSPEVLRSRDLSLLRENELGESMRDPFAPVTRTVY